MQQWLTATSHQRAGTKSVLSWRSFFKQDLPRALVVIGGVGFGLIYLKDVLAPFFVAILFGYLLLPLVEWFEDAVWLNPCACFDYCGSGAGGDAPSGGWGQAFSYDADQGHDDEDGEGDALLSDGEGDDEVVGESKSSDQGLSVKAILAGSKENLEEGDLETPEVLGDTGVHGVMEDSARSFRRALGVLAAMVIAAGGQSGTVLFLGFPSLPHALYSPLLSDL